MSNCFSCHAMFLPIFIITVYNKSIIRSAFCDIRNNQVLGKCFSLARPSAQLIIVTSTLIIPDITKASSNNCLLSVSRRSIFACLPLTTQPRPIIILLILIYYIDTSVLLENIPLVKFVKTTSGTRVVYSP